MNTKKIESNRTGIYEQDMEHACRTKKLSSLFQRQQTNDLKITIIFFIYLKI